MALRLRRDVQKSSYYLWFLGAEEARGLRGPRVINPVLPYLIERSNEQEPLKVTLQISHKGIKILQGSSKHFIPHSAITSSVQTDDIVACVLLLYNPATKCPLHVHAYRCDSETTAETLHQQLQTLINRPENQKRFEELESRLGVSQANLANLTKVVESKHQTPRRLESSPKRFESSLGSDTGHSTRESECSEEHNVSPMGLTPPALKQNAELFDSLAAELRAKLNGNGPPLLLPPRDYDTVHRSKGNLAAIELRRCRNSLIVGGPTSTTTVQPTTVKQVSSRGSSGIGSDLAPSPERQDTHSSSEDERWSNEADNSVIALKASQIAIEKKQPLSRKSAMQPPSDNYLRDLPAKPYKSLTRDKEKPVKQNSSRPAKEEEIRPIIMRPSDYDAKFKRILMEKHHDDDGGIKSRLQSSRVKEIGYQLESEHFRKYPVRQRQSSEQTPEIAKYNQMEKIFQKKLSLERETSYKMHSCDDFDSDQEAGVYRKENLTDKQKFQEFSTKVEKPITDHQKFGRQRYADPKDLPFESVKNAQQYLPGYTRSPELNHDQNRDRQRSKERNRERSRVRGDGRDPDQSYSHSNDRNPYREPDSIPYMESIEKMMKSPVMRYKSFEEDARDTDIIPRTNLRKSHSKTSDEYEVEREFAYNRKQRNFQEPAVILAKDRFKDAKEKFRAMERSRYSPEEIEASPPMPPRRRTSLEPTENEVRYDDWSDDEPVGRGPPRDQRDVRQVRSGREPRNLRDAHDPREIVRDVRGYRDIRDNRNIREVSEADSRAVREIRERDPRDVRDIRADPREIRVDPREIRGDPREIRGDPREIRGDPREIRGDPRETRDDPREIRSDPRDFRDGGNRNHRDPRDHRDAHEIRDTRDYRQNDKRQDVVYPPVANSKSLSNLAKGYRHSYAEPALARSGGRVGLAAVNPF